MEGMVILAVIVWIVLLLICSRGVYLYATSNVEKIVAELNETKQIYWAGKIEKCFKKFRLGTFKHSARADKELWSDCWYFVRKSEFSDKGLQRLTRVINVFRVIFVLLLILPLLGAISVLIIDKFF